MLAQLGVSKVTHVEPKDKDCKHCHEPMTRTGLKDVTHKIHYEPATFAIEEIQSHKYKCTCCSHLESPKVPASIYPKSYLGDSLIIHAVMAKYNDLIPMERFARISNRLGACILPSHLI